MKSFQNQLRDNLAANMAVRAQQRTKPQIEDRQEEPVARKRGAKPESKPETKDDKAEGERKGPKVVNASFDVKALRTKMGAGRPAFAKLVGVSAASILNWESGKSIKPGTVAKLKDLEKKFDAGEVKVPESRRGRKPGTKVATKKAVSAASGKRRGRPPKVATVAPKQSSAKVDVKALRSKLGMTLKAFSEAVGTSLGSVGNWERGTTPQPKFMAKLQELQTKAGSGPTPVAASEPKRRGRPPKAQVATTGNGVPNDRFALAETMIAFARTCSPETREKLGAAAAALLTEK